MAARPNQETAHVTHKENDARPFRPAALALGAGLGVAGMASAATTTPTPTPSASAEATPGTSGGHGMRGGHGHGRGGDRGGAQAAELAAKLGVDEAKVTEALKAFREANKPDHPAGRGHQAGPRRQGRGPGQVPGGVAGH